MPEFRFRALALLLTGALQAASEVRIHPLKLTARPRALHRIVRRRLASIILPLALGFQRCRMPAHGWWTLQWD